MKIIQYTFSIPKDKQTSFIDYCQRVLGPTWKKYGSLKYECAQTVDHQLVNQQTIEPNKFIERLYFDDNFDIHSFYQAARQNEPEIVRSYEDKFNATNIRLEIFTLITSL